MMHVTDAQRLIASIQHAMEAVIVGQQAVLHQVVTAVIADGHVLLEGAPGLAKTTLVRELATLLNVPFGRVQCTPDLLPSDVVGTMVLADDQPGQYRLTFAPGPIFASLLLVDEINRTTPRTQSALLEAMQERTVTVAGVTHPLPRPFIVMATQNPSEMEGTYPLPEAQQDRFLYQVLISYPTHADLVEIARREAGAPPTQGVALCDADTLAEIRGVARQIVVADHLLAYAASVVQATHPDAPQSDALVRESVRYGASPRAVQALIRTAQVEALRAGRLQVDFADIQAVALPVLRHRIVLRREAQVRQLRSDEIVHHILSRLPAI